MRRRVRGSRSPCWASPCGWCHGPGSRGRSWSRSRVASTCCSIRACGSRCSSDESRRKHPARLRRTSSIPSRRCTRSARGCSSSIASGSAARCASGGVRADGPRSSVSVCRARGAEHARRFASSRTPRSLPHRACCGRSSGSASDSTTRSSSSCCCTRSATCGDGIRFGSR